MDDLPEGCASGCLEALAYVAGDILLSMLPWWVVLGLATLIFGIGAVMIFSGVPL